LFNYAHAVVEPKIIKLSNPKRFVLELGICSILAALRWNKEISVAMLKILLRWILSIRTYVL
jgi:hypothetical protein